MRRSTLNLVIALGAIATALLVLSPRVGRASNDVALAVIVSPTSKQTSISSSELRRAFMGERISDKAGNPMIPLNHPPRTPDRVGFDSVTLRMNADAVGRFWIDRKIRGTSGPPRTVENLAMLRRVVEKLPGAIGYIRTQQLSNEVRAIRVDGKLPEDPGYPLRYQP